MNVAIDAPKRPALRYFGGKWNLAPWIISYFPKHLNYVEPCGGAASVLLQKPRSPLETINDLDGNVVNFFRVLRDRSDELIQKIRLTPWARAEYELSLQPCEDVVEKARRFFVRSWMCIGASHHGATPGSWRVVTFDNGYYMELPHESLSIVAKRLLGVQIENKPAINIIERFDNSDSLIYFDPPYVESERSHKKEYAFEWAVEEHETAATLLRSAAGYIVVSGYRCDMYDEIYDGWHRVDREAQTNSGGKRIESLWLSPRTWSALQDSHEDLPMFAL